MTQDEATIFKRLHQFSEGYARKDLPSVLATFSRKMHAIVVIGSGDGTLVIGREALEQQLNKEFARWTDLRLNAKWAELNIVHTVAWVSAVSEATSVQITNQLTGRLTAVLVKESDEWLIAHLHFSFPIQQSHASGLLPMEKTVGEPMETFSSRGILPSNILLPGNPTNERKQNYATRKI